eukprot:4064709-Ditylum_brightwellii.AAC.1
MALTILRSTSYIYHKLLIVVGLIEANDGDEDCADYGEDDSEGNGDDVDADDGAADGEDDSVGNGDDD